MSTMIPSEPSGIYLHIPFCVTRCHYCNFATGGYESEVAERYTQAILLEIQRAVESDRFDSMKAVDTIYFGGGTPTTLSVAQLTRILEQVHKTFEISPTSEVTTEANPGSVSRHYLEALRQSGVNRISFGVQSFDDRELQMIGRTHTTDEARLAVDHARRSGFENISLDLIAGLPEQSLSTWRRNLKEVFSLVPEHLSVYLLELYKDAPLLHRIDRGEIGPVDEELTVASYFELVDEASRHGYEHYELSNWARPRRQSRHNLKYWTGETYWAFGVSAAGYDRLTRWSNTRNIHEYLDRVEKAISPVAESISLSDEDRQGEALFLQLRLNEGVDLAQYEARFGVDVLERYGSELARLSSAGLIEVKDGTLRISRAGSVLANEVFEIFV